MNNMFIKALLLKVVKMSKIANMLNMIQILKDKKIHSIQSLAEKLEVSERMIRQYKSELECAGIYIESIRGPYGGYYLNQNVKLPENMNKPVSAIVENKETYNILNKAINSKNKCYIEYYSKEHDNKTKRIIRPYELIVLDNEWGVSAFCENKQEIRHFYLNRIIKIELLNEKY